MLLIRVRTPMSFLFYRVRKIRNKKKKNEKVGNLTDCGNHDKKKTRSTYSTLKYNIII